MTISGGPRQFRGLNTGERLLAWIHSICVTLITGLVFMPAPLPGREPDQISPSSSLTVSDEELPLNATPVSYSSKQPDDVVARLQTRLNQGEIKFELLGTSGYLKDLLAAFNISETSQLLVFSKSSAQARLITPQTPRAIYFNDQVYVGWVPGSTHFEISAVDPLLGATFYQFSQQSNSEPKFVRESSCLLCHVSRSTLRVPGHLDRSFTTDASGNLRQGWSRVTHETPYQNRWAGWFVTGAPTGLTHLGNRIGESLPGVKLEPQPFESVKDIPISGNSRLYLQETSDVLPHLVLDHQVHGHNLLTRLSYESRLGKPLTALKPLVRYLLFSDEPVLPVSVEGSSPYRVWFESQGPKDDQGRSLRMFQLKDRVFQYPLSYLIYDPLFDALPESLRWEILGDLKEQLTDISTNHPDNAMKISSAAAIEILRNSKAGLPHDW